MPNINIRVVLGIGAAIVVLIAAAVVWYFRFSPVDFGGVVTDSKGTPLVGVVVKLAGEQFTTGGDGKFLFKRISRDSYSIEAKEENYKPYSKIVAVSSGGMQFNIDLVPIATKSSSESPQITISRPTDSSSVVQSGEIEGIATGIPDGKHLWIAVHPIGSRGYWPQIGEVHPTGSPGKWNQTATYGGTNDVGKSFEIIAVLIDYGHKTRLPH